MGTTENLAKVKVAVQVRPWCKPCRKTATYVKGHLSGVIVLSGNPAFGDTSPTPAFQGVGTNTVKVAIKVVVHLNVHWSMKLKLS